MKIEGLVITAAEIAVIAVMGLCGWLALSQSGAYGWIKEWISSRSTAAEHFLPVIIWGAIFVFGLVTVTLGKKGCGALTWVVVVISLPSFLAFNSLDLLKIFDTRLTITTELSFLQAMSLGTVIMTCYCLMSSMNVLKQSRSGLLRRQASIGEIGREHV